MPQQDGGARRVELCEPLRQLLRHCVRGIARRSAQVPLCPPRWQVRWRLLRQAAGLAGRQRPWVPDVLRHTFASYHALTHRDLPALQLQLGHRDARLLLTRYLNLPGLRRADLSRFWRLCRAVPTEVQRRHTPVAGKKVVAVPPVGLLGVR